MIDDHECEFTGLRDPIYRLPRPWWHFVFPGLWMLLWISTALLVEWALLQPDLNVKESAGVVVTRPLKPAEFGMGLIMAALFLAMAFWLPLEAALTSPFVICKQGFKFRRNSNKPLIIPWETIPPCYWGLYNRGTLTIPNADGLGQIAIPEQHRAEVEAILRRFGKWRD